MCFGFPGSADVRAASLEVQRQKQTLVRKIVVGDYVGGCLEIRPCSPSSNDYVGERASNVLAGRV